MSGFVCTIRAGDAKSVSKMLSRIRHRGPDGASIFESAKMTIGQRLHTVFDRNRGESPARSQDGRRVLAFNGRIHNNDMIRRRMATTWETDGDTETLLRLYEAKGVECVHELDGYFAFVLRDGNDFFAARDHFGIKPLYYATRDSGRIFASELKAFGKMCSEFHEFPPGCYFHSKEGMHRFYQVPAPTPRDRTVGNAALSLRLALDGAVGKHAEGDETPGVFLSGGLDSAILAWALRHTHKQAPTFSVGVKGCLDQGAAEEAAEWLGTEHHHRILRPDEVVEILPKVIYLLESFDARVVRDAVCNYFLSELAAKHISSVLCGDGADELFGGFASLRDVPAAERPNVMWRQTSGLHNAVLQRVDRMTMAFGMEARVPVLDRPLVSLALSIPDWMKIGADGETKWILRHAYADVLPKSIVHRAQHPMHVGAGIKDILSTYAEKEVSDTEFARDRLIAWSEPLKNKEEALYYRIWRRSFVPEMAKLVGRTMAA